MNQIFIFYVYLKRCLFFKFLKKIYRGGSMTPTTSETLLLVTLVKWLKAVRKSLGEPISDVAGINNGSLIT